MPKRKRASRLFYVNSESEDEIAVAMPERIARRYREDIEIEDDVKDQLRAGASAVANDNGIFTPLTLEKNSEEERSAGASEIIVIDDTEAESAVDEPRTAPDDIRPIKHVANRVLVPDCRDGPAYPRSLYQGFIPPVEELSEREALVRLAAAYEESYSVDDPEKPDFTYFSLDQFSVYRPHDAAGHGHELVTLDRLSRDRYPRFCFDGILCYGEHRFYVRNVHFETMTIDGYGDPEVTDMRHQLCIQTSHARKHNAWLKLGTPAVEYRRFYQPFLWLVRFTKHFVDYLLCTENVTISHFRVSFYTWLQERHEQDDQHASLKEWLHEANLRDFRVTVAAHVDFLWKECYGTQHPSDDIKICKQPLWGEVHPARLTAIPEQPNRAQRTVVTPFAYDCFKTMYFADQFQETPITDIEVRERVQGLKKKLGLTPLYNSQNTNTTILTPMSDSRESRESQAPISAPTSFPTTDADANATTHDIAVGDVVMLPPEKDGQWKSAEDAWYAYVQRIRTTKDGQTRLDVIWLYQASDTTLGTAYYPFPNELFFSDNCGCDTRHDKEAWNLEEVIQKVDVSWYSRDPYKETGLFVRQKFRTVPETGHFDFHTLQRADFRCHHQPDHIEEEEEEQNLYAIGDVVLVRDPDPQQTLCTLGQIISGRGQVLRLRRLRRKREVHPSARANELILTAEVFEAASQRQHNSDDDEDEGYKVVRKCHVRRFTREEIDTGNITTPYDRDGCGNTFILEAEADVEMDDVDSELTNFPSINDSWDPRVPSTLQQLTGLGIFCGGGTFDRGLEEGGAVRFRYAVDWAEHALHSYRANLEDPTSIDFFLGSVNDYLAQALSGQFTTASGSKIAMPGSVHVISAGSPCQGFSRMQLFTASQQSKQNASMVASVVAFADMYCPEHLILENVVSMTECREERKEHNVFSQILAALVGLGYQVQQFLVDAWSHGSSQQRPRVFVIATAPGLKPLSQPPCSHAHPARIKTQKLGTSTNGLPFGKRNVNPDVALPHISPQEAVGDLPTVYDSQPQLCPAFPDHRTASDESDASRERIRAVPIYPRGMKLVKAWTEGLLSGEPLRWCATRGPLRQSKESTMYARVLPHGLFPTIITKLTPADGMNGRCLHWNQHRVITVMEAKRAQGYLDHEVLVGNASQQMKIVGNSVDRKSALVLGLSLRESWIRSSSFSERDSGNDEYAHVDSIEIDQMAHEDETRVDSLEVDNRTVKMALTLSREDIEAVNKVTATTGRTFKEILRRLSAKEEHRLARQSIHGAGNGIGNGNDASSS